MDSLSNTAVDLSDASIADYAAAEAAVVAVLGSAPANDYTPPPAPLIGSAIVNRAAFADALAAVCRVVSKRNTLPFLGNVLIRGTDTGVMLTATDLDIVASKPATGAADPGFGFTVPAHMLLDICKRAKDSEYIGIDYDSYRGSARFEFAGVVFTLQSLPAADFDELPIMKPVDFSHRWSIGADDFRTMLGKTAFAMSCEQTRYYLNGVFLHPIVGAENMNVLRAVATDGHRLAHYSVPLPLGSGDMPGVIIPSFTVAVLGHYLKPVYDGRGKDKRLVSPERVSVAVCESRMQVSIGDLTVTSKLVDGTFPDYGRVIPQANDFHVTLDKSEFAVAVDQVSVIASERGSAVRLSFLDPGTVRFTVDNPDAGSATTDVTAEFDGPADHLGDIGFNARYVLDLLANLDGDKVKLSLADPGSPTLFTGPGDPALHMVLMPMRV